MHFLLLAAICVPCGSDFDQNLNPKPGAFRMIPGVVWKDLGSFSRIPGGRFEGSRGVVLNDPGSVLKDPGGPGGAQMEPNGAQIKPNGVQMEPGGAQMELNGAQWSSNGAP